jgi:hypothetical protein
MSLNVYQIAQQSWFHPSLSMGDSGDSERNAFHRSIQHSLLHSGPSNVTRESRRSGHGIHRMDWTCEHRPSRQRQAMRGLLLLFCPSANASVALSIVSRPVETLHAICGTNRPWLSDDTLRGNQFSERRWLLPMPVRSIQSDTITFRRLPSYPEKQHATFTECHSVSDQPASRFARKTANTRHNWAICRGTRFCQNHSGRRS